MTTITKIALLDIDPHGNMLWVKKRGLDTWILPGGKIEEGETDRDCLERELGEELNVTCPRHIAHVLNTKYNAVGQLGTTLHMRMWAGNLDPRFLRPSQEIEYTAYFPMNQLNRCPIPEDFKARALDFCHKLFIGDIVSQEFEASRARFG